MLVKDILWMARQDYLDDCADVESADEWFNFPHPTPLWPDESLLRHLTTAVNEWCKETGCLRDHVTEAICKVNLLAGQHTYALDSRITEIHKGYLDSGSIVLPKNDEWLDNNVGQWRTTTGNNNWILPDYDMGYLRIIYYPASSLGYWSGAVDFTALSKTVAKTGALFSTYLAVGDEIVISGTTLNGTTAVPKTFTLATVAADSLTVSETVSDEAAVAAIIRKVTDTMWMTVSRLPLNPLTMAAITTQSPEIRSEDHPYLVHGICREAYSKQDSQTLDVEKANKHRNLFEYYKKQGRAQRDWLRMSEQTMIPHPGTL